MTAKRGLPCSIVINFAAPSLLFPSSFAILRARKQIMFHLRRSLRQLSLPRTSIFRLGKFHVTRARGQAHTRLTRIAICLLSKGILLRKAEPESRKPSSSSSTEMDRRRGCISRLVQTPMARLHI